MLASVGLALVFSSGGTKPAQKTTGSNQAGQAEGPKGATALDVEQANQSISQDISSINDDQDFPADKLSDKSLGL